MSWRKTVAILAIPAALAMLGACRENAKPAKSVAEAPARELDWPGSGDGFWEEGHMPQGFFGISMGPKTPRGARVLETWKWSDGGLMQLETTELPIASPRIRHVQVLPGNRYLAGATPSNEGGLWPLVISTIPESKKCDEVILPQGWGCEGSGISRDGKYVAVFSRENIINPPPDKNPNYYRYRVGVTTTTSLHIKWIGELTINSPSVPVRTIAVSNDGKYVALGGWKNGIAVFSASEEKVLWRGRQPEVVTIGYVDFSSDGLTLYALDSGGGYVFVHDTKDGKVRSRWCASESGNPEYGHRISCMAVSPDDAWVAAGTGPEGLVYLFNTKAPGQPVVFPHGLGTTLMVSFSPDSKHLASVAGGKIKVWNIGSRTANPPPK